MFVSLAEDRRPRPEPITARPRLDGRRSALAAAVLMPAGLAATAALLPWARRIQPVEWPTAEGVALVPAILVGLVLIALLYRPYLAASVVDHRGAKVVRAVDLGRGFAATWCAPVVAVFFAAVGGGRIWSTAVIASAWAAALLHSLERDRRRAPQRRLRWTDPLLERLRPRPWGAVGCAAVGGGLLAVSALPGSQTDPSDSLALLGLILLGSAVVPYISAFDTIFTHDSGPKGSLEYGVALSMFGSSAVLIALVRRTDGMPALASCAVLAVVFAGAAEFLRRRLRSRRIETLVNDGHAAQLAATYGWRG